MDDVIVFPLKDRIDIWRVLLKGTDGSLYEDRWFYMIIEFTAEYPQHYPLFRFVHPPFHPNITDQGRVCIDTLDQNYRSDMSIIDLIADIKLLLLQPNFDDCIDLKRKQMGENRSAFEATVRDWNNKNGKASPDEWKNQWKIQPDGDVVKNMQVKNVALVPEQFLCPITRKIMKEPVKASSGVFYEKSALEKYIQTTPNATCKVKTDKLGKPVELKKTDSNLAVDNEMKVKIAKWIKENDYREDEEEGDEDDNIIYFRNNGKPIKSAKFSILYKDGTAPPPPAESKSTSQMNRPVQRPRPELSEK